MLPREHVSEIEWCGDGVTGASPAREDRGHMVSGLTTKAVESLGKSPAKGCRGDSGRSGYRPLPGRAAERSEKLGSPLSAHRQPPQARAGAAGRLALPGPELGASHGRAIDACRGSQGRPRTAVTGRQAGRDLAADKQAAKAAARSPEEPDRDLVKTIAAQFLDRYLKPRAKPELLQVESPTS